MRTKGRRERNMFRNIYLNFQFEIEKECYIYFMYFLLKYSFKHFALFFN